MPVVCVPFSYDRLHAAHNDSILACGILPPDAGCPLGTHFGVLRPGMAQEPTTDRGVSKLYIPLSGEADLITPEGTFRLQQGSVYLIREGTFHEVRQVGDSDFVNVCISWKEPAS
ncbi:MAG: hypothetical protein IT204_08805 [Fimbriimonadaceae bacterium]|nr:hypothetical protein [Fimbriimonadaceae bacterium]